MKILWISHLLPYPPAGGVVQRSYNLIKEVSRRNDIFLFAFNQKAWLSTPEEVINAKNEFLKFCENVYTFELTSDKSKLARYNLIIGSFFNKNSYTVNWTKSKIMQQEISKFLANNHIELIHCDTIGLAEYVKEVRKIPKILHHHNIESEMMLRRAQNEKNLLKKLYFYIEGLKLKNYEKVVCPIFNLNIVVSELDQQRLLKIVKNTKTEIIPNGVDTNYFKPQNNKYIKHSIVFAGRMNAYPNEDAMIWFLQKIWPIIKKDLPDAVFTIAGRNPTARMKRLVNNNPSILITGYVEDIRPFVQQAEVYICPIRDGGGTKVKLLDAMAMGKAIVTTSIGAEGLNVQNGEHVLIADEPSSFANQVLTIFSNHDLRISLGRKARQLVEEKYSWHIIGKKINEIYSSFVHNSF